MHGQDAVQVKKQIVHSLVLWLLRVDALATLPAIYWCVLHGSCSVLEISTILCVCVCVLLVIDVDSGLRALQLLAKPC